MLRCAMRALVRERRLACVTVCACNKTAAGARVRDCMCVCARRCALGRCVRVYTRRCARGLYIGRVGCATWVRVPSVDFEQAGHVPANLAPAVHGESSFALPAHACDSRESGRYLGEKLLDAVLTSSTQRALLTCVLTPRRFDDTIRRSCAARRRALCDVARVHGQYLGEKLLDAF